MLILFFLADFSSIKCNFGQTYTGCLTKANEHSLPYYLSIADSCLM